MDEKNGAEVVPEVMSYDFKSPLITEDLPVLRRLPTGDVRWYLEMSGDPLFPWNYYLGVTSFIKRYQDPTEGLMRWWAAAGSVDAAERQLEEEANYGTYFHHVACSVLVGKPYSLHPDDIRNHVLDFTQMNKMPAPNMKRWIKDIKKDVIGFIQFCTDTNIEPLFVEGSLRSKQLGLAGSMDIIATFDVQALDDSGKKIKGEKERVTGIIDLKKNRKAFYDSHFIQVAIYKQIARENFPGLNIERGWLYGCHDFNIPLSSRVTPYRLKEVVIGKDDYLNTAINSMFMRYRHPGQNEPRFSTSIAEVTVNRGTNLDNLWESFDPIKFYNSMKEIEV